MTTDDKPDEVGWLDMQPRPDDCHDLRIDFGPFARHVEVLSKTVNDEGGFVEFELRITEEESE